MRKTFKIIALCAISTFAVSAAQATVLLDTYSNSSWWAGTTTNLPNFVSSGFKSMPAACFVGDGGLLITVGKLISFADSDNHPVNNPNPADFDLRFAFFGSVSDFNSDPYRLNPPEPAWRHTYDAPSNANWATPVGSRTNSYGTFSLFWVESDVSELGIMTTNGAVQGFGLTTDGGAGVIHSFATHSRDGIGLSGSFWYSDTVRGTGTMQSIGLETPYDASRVVTAVPEPGTVLALGGGIVALLSRRRRASRLFR